MKKAIGILVLGLFLVGCSAPAKVVQKSLMDYGSIKKGMNGQMLLEVLGGSSVVFWQYPLGKKGGHVWFHPSIEATWWDPNYFDNYNYGLECPQDLGSKFSNCRLVNIWEDPVKTYEYYISIMPEGKSKNNYIKWRAQTLLHPPYITWKERKTKKTKIVKNPDKENKKKETTTKEEVKKATSGSAFFVSNTGYIITNFHVIETCNDNSKIFYNKKEIDAKLIAKDNLLDLALLKAEVSNNKFVTISNKAPRKLQRIIAAGYPFGKYLSDDMKFTAGIVSSLKGLMDDSTRLQIDAALNPGNSGGPIVDENTGELVAVAVAGLRKDVTEAVNYGIKAGSVKNFLESNQIDPSTFSKNFSTGDIAELLESTVLYTFCN